MAGKDTVPSTEPSGEHVGFLDPKDLPTTNNPPQHKAKPKRNSSVPGITIEPTENKKEIGGREGSDPTRFGDWEKNGRCVDF